LAVETVADGAADTDVLGGDLGRCAAVNADAAPTV
jgi:hypothetical protein